MFLYVDRRETLCGRNGTQRLKRIFNNKRLIIKPWPLCMVSSESVHSNDNKCLSILEQPWHLLNKLSGVGSDWNESIQRRVDVGETIIERTQRAIAL